MCIHFPYCVDMVLHCATIKQMVETDVQRKECSGILVIFYSYNSKLVLVQNQKL